MYSSASVFRDGGIGVGRSFQHPLGNRGDDGSWNRAYSFSRNLDELGGSYPMRSSSFSRIPKDVDGYGYSLNERVSAHRVNSMERIPTDVAGSRGYGSRALPYNRSFMDSLGFAERDSDMPMSRARSMMYLGEDDFEGSLPQRSSKADLALLAQSAINPNTDMMSGMAPIKETTSTSTPPSSKEPLAKDGSPKPPTPEWRRSRSPLPLRGSRSPPHTSLSPPRSSLSPPRGSREEEDREKRHGKYRFPCRDFEKGVCSRGAACKFYHDPAKGRRWGG